MTEIEYSGMNRERIPTGEQPQYVSPNNGGLILKWIIAFLSVTATIAGLLLWLVNEKTDTFVEKTDFHIEATSNAAAHTAINVRMDSIDGDVDEIKKTTEKVKKATDRIQFILEQTHWAKRHKKGKK